MIVLEKSGIPIYLVPFLSTNKSLKSSTVENEILSITVQLVIYVNYIYIDFEQQQNHK